MPSSTIFHAVTFAVGAAVGATTAISIANRRKEPPTPVPPPTRAVIDVGPNGTLGLVQQTPLSGDVLKYGNPGPISDLITRKAYTLGYDRRMRHPAWTAEHLTLADIKYPEGPGGGDRHKSVFKEDESIPLPFRALLKDYFRSGYDRGHMTPARDAMFSQEAMDETFFLSNMCPQVGDGFNRHYWAYLERWCRTLTDSFSDVFVFTVPLYLPKKDLDGKYRVSYEVIGSPPNVAVPTHFAKVVLATRPVSAYNPKQVEVSTGAFVLPNASIPDETQLTSFVVPIEDVEKAAGLTIFPDAIKATSKHICATTKCEVIIKRFDDARQNATKSIGGFKRQ
ncbi:hypothetical protein CPB86DRAFT_806930 [Serendipita vermifera]|nr:hypothetical protein CPB86DRAFT_806930 [Serendipita vermifera]